MLTHKNDMQVSIGLETLGTTVFLGTPVVAKYELFDVGRWVFDYSAYASRVIPIT